MTNFAALSPKLVALLLGICYFFVDAVPMSVNFPAILGLTTRKKARNWRFFKLLPNKHYYHT
jgi:hypothetical protein